MTIQEKIRAALKTVIETVDADAKVHDYKIYPLDTSPEKIYALCSITDEVTQAKTILWWSFTRRSRSRDENNRGVTSGSLQGRDQTEEWELEYYKTVLDPVNSETPFTPSEYEFQNTIDAVTDELWRSDVIHALTRDLITLQSTAITEQGVQYVTGEDFCHHAVITVTFAGNRFVGQ